MARTAALALLAILASPALALAQIAPEPTPVPDTGSVPDPDPVPDPASDPTPDADPVPGPAAVQDPDPLSDPEPDPAPDSPLPSAVATAGDVEIGFTPSDGAFLRTRDRAWSLRIGVLAQLRFSASSTPDPSRQIEFVPVMARLYLQGTLVEPWIRYYFQTEFAGQQAPPATGPVPATPRILDVWAEAQPHEAIGVRAGVMRPPFSRSWITGLNRMILFDRTEANAFFRSHGAAPLGAATHGELAAPLWDRDIGAYLFGAPASGLFEYYLGVFNGNGFLFGRNTAPNAMPMIRLAVNPLGRVAYDETPAVSDPHQPFRFQVAVGGYYDQPRIEYASTDPMTMMPVILAATEEQIGFEADATVQFESVYLSGEVYYRNRRTVDGSRHDELGAMGVAGWMFWAPYLELAARFSLIDPDLSTPGTFRQTYDAGLNFYGAGNALKLELRYTLAISDADFRAGGVPNDVPGYTGPPISPVTIPGGLAVHTVGLWGQLYF